MVLSDKVEGAVNSHGPGNRIIIPGGSYIPARALINFIHTADVECPAAIRVGLLHQVAIALIYELCRLPIETILF